MGEFPPFLCLCRFPVCSRVRLKLLPAFLMSDRKRVACVIYARDFSPVASCSSCTLHIRTDAEPIVSYLGYIGARVSYSRHGARPEENLRPERGVCTGGQETRMTPRHSAILFPILRIRISCVTRAREPRERTPLCFEIINVSRC